MQQDPPNRIGVVLGGIVCGVIASMLMLAGPLFSTPGDDAFAMRWAALIYPASLFATVYVAVDRPTLRGALACAGVALASALVVIFNFQAPERTEQMLVGGSMIVAPAIVQFMVVLAQTRKERGPA